MLETERELAELKPPSSPPASRRVRGRSAATLASGALAGGRARLRRGCAAFPPLRGSPPGTDRAPRWPIEVTVTRQRKGHAGIRCFTATDLTAADRTIVDAIPCTSVARTLLGIAAQAPGELTAAIAAAEKRDLLDLAQIQSLIARPSRRPGAPALGQALAEHTIELEWTRGRLEQRFLALCRRAGLRRPSVNAYVAVPGWAGEVDFHWPALRLIVETDGWDSHSDRAAFEADRRRDQHLVAAGWRVVRVTWRQVVFEPERVVAMLGRLVSAPRYAGRPSR